MPSYGHTGPDPVFKDYFGMAIPKWAMALGFEDRSWHNDAGAIMGHEFVAHGGERLSLRLFFADPEDLGNWMGSEFAVYLVRVDPADESDSSNGITLYSGQDELRAQQVATEALTFLRVIATHFTET
jgi:hypothetical protein